ncbi:hypothetical protein [Streptomyces sp. 067-1]|uniref:hypothetical protein n=1 Tax=Streptomyces sp. 067-1 TaxID=2789269 RepID=UPI0039F569EE
MFTVVGAVFFMGGLIFFFNPFGMAEKYIRATSSMSGTRTYVSERFMSRRVGTPMVFVGCVMLVARVLLALGVEADALMPLLPVVVLAFMVLVGRAVVAIYHASSHRKDSQ